jgi:hypothetical protein
MVDYHLYNALFFSNMNQPTDYPYKNLNFVTNNKINIEPKFAGKKVDE